MNDLDAMFEEVAEQQGREHDEWIAKGGLERSRQKSERERQSLIRQGIIDEDGCSLVPESDDEDEECEREDS